MPKIKRIVDFDDFLVSIFRVFEKSRRRNVRQLAVGIRIAPLLRLIHGSVVVRSLFRPRVELVVVHFGRNIALFELDFLPENRPSVLQHVLQVGPVLFQRVHMHELENRFGCFVGQFLRGVDQVVADQHLEVIAADGIGERRLELEDGPVIEHRVDVQSGLGIAVEHAHHQVLNVGVQGRVVGDLLVLQLSGDLIQAVSFERRIAWLANHTGTRTAGFRDTKCRL